MAKKSASTPYVGMARSEQEVAIAAAKNEKELDAMWAEWERIGYSDAGRIAARIAVRRAELTGEPLHPADRRWIKSVGLADLLPKEE